MKNNEAWLKYRLKVKKLYSKKEANNEIKKRLKKLETENTALKIEVENLKAAFNKRKEFMTEKR